MLVNIGGMLGNTDIMLAHIAVMGATLKDKYPPKVEMFATIGFSGAYKRSEGAPIIVMGANKTIM